MRLTILCILSAATLICTANFTRHDQMIKECLRNAESVENFEYTLTKNGVSFGCVGIPKLCIETHYFIVDSQGRRKIREQEAVKVHYSDGFEYSTSWNNVDFPSDCGGMEASDKKADNQPRACEGGYEGTYPHCHPTIPDPLTFTSSCAYISPPPEWRVTTACPVVLRTPTYPTTSHQYLPPNNYLPPLPYLPPSRPEDDTCAHIQFPSHNLDQVSFPLLYIPFCAGTNPMASVDIIRMERMFPKARPVPYLCNKCGYHYD